MGHVPQLLRPVQFSPLLRRGFRLQTLGLDHIPAEHFNGLSHLTDLVASLRSEHGDIVVAVGHLAHGLGHRIDRFGNA